ncbi:MAG: hypothetical protein MJ096_01540 [Clostridia bacterium]|nr:hypothetical protein [Clostridia bacterium]
MNGNITKKQKKVALRLVFDDPSLSLEGILADEGVTTEKYAAWLADSDFTRFLGTVSKNAAEAGGARIVASLSEKCRSGETSALKAYFDVLAKLKAHGEDACAADDGIEAVRREIWGDVSSP